MNTTVIIIIFIFAFMSIILFIMLWTLIKSLHRLNKKDKFNYFNTIYKCPVCMGSGLVPNGFYLNAFNNTTSQVTSEKCRTCNGSGIISKY